MEHRFTVYTEIKLEADDEKDAQEAAEYILYAARKSVDEGKGRFGSVREFGWKVGEAEIHFGDGLERNRVTDGC